jgi:hypothetical protein
MGPLKAAAIRGRIREECAMLRKTLFVLALGAVLSATPGSAQDLVSLIPTLYGPGGITVDTDKPAIHGFTHHAHFAGSFLDRFQAFDEAFAAQLSSEPVPSPASGFTYTFDSQLGVFKRSTQSFGPILSDRSETIGRGKFTFGFNYQHFDFDSLGGVDLHSLPVVLTHFGARNPAIGLFTFDVITVNVNINAKVNQFTAFATYGIASRLDVSVAVPFEKVDLSADGAATIQKLGSAFPGGEGDQTHFFSSNFPGTAHKSGTASGIGDVLVRVKGKAFEWAETGLAVGLDVRIPTGDEKNLLGTGAVGVKPSLDLSYAGKGISPHFKIAYQWNGKSFLGVNGNAATVQGFSGPLPLVKGDLPKEFYYEAGADFAVSSRVTVALDYLGRRFFKAERAFATQFGAPDPGGTIHPFADTQTTLSSFNTSEGAVGLKYNPVGNLLVDLNVLFNLDHNALHHKVTPLVGFEYTF